jgi:RNA polymerase-binding protein DksA
MNKKKLEYYKSLLLKQKEGLQKEIKRIEKENLYRLGREVSGNLSDYPIHMADVATDDNDRQKELELMNSERRILAQIEEALPRIENGTYGFCLECRARIQEKRLEAKPYAHLCIECKKKEEKETR